MDNDLSYALDTFYLLVSGALVMWMAAGFAMLEAGLVRSKNTAEILTKNLALFAIACVMFMLSGYRIMYPGEASGWLPSFGFGIGAEHGADALLSGGEQAPGFSARADFFFQVVFVATAMSIVSGAVAERMKLWSFLLFTVVMTGLIYPIQGYWKWGGGPLEALGFVDFAGSGVVHLAGAAAALSGVLQLGARKGKYNANGSANAIPGANLPLAALGTFILWMGWFGFNGGSALKISSLGDANVVAQVFVNTNMAACGGAISALLMARWYFKKADLTMVLNGALAGLVAITAEPSTPSAELALGIGALGGAVVFAAILLIDKAHIDDPVGAISVHGVVGGLGLLLVPLSHDTATLGTQALGAAVIFVFVFVASSVTWWLLNKLVGLRVSEEDEYEGVDIAECGLEAYPEFIKR